ncbi:hypothetical protein Nmel_003812 [Mimus melanotis]
MTGLEKPVFQIIAFDELRTDFKSPIDQCNPAHARERLRNIERICFLLRKLKEADQYALEHESGAPDKAVTKTKEVFVLLTPVISVPFLLAGAAGVLHPQSFLHHVFMCSGVAHTGVECSFAFLSLMEVNILKGVRMHSLRVSENMEVRYFRCPADSSELAYDPPAVMNADTLSYCQKEAWCKLAFYLLSFFYYLYW